MKKSLTTMLLFALACMSILAQDKEPKTEKKSKIVIIEKVVDEDGKETMKKVVKEGKEAEEMLKEMDIEIEGDDIDFGDGNVWISDDGEEMETKKRMMFIDGDDEEIEIEVDASESSKEVSVEIEEEVKRKVKVTVKEDGEEEVMEWEDEGKTPADIQEKLDDMGVIIDHPRGKKGHKKGKRMRRHGDKRKGMGKKMWKKHDGDRERGHRIMKIDGDHVIMLEADDIEGELSAEDIFFKSGLDKPRLGVMIEDHDDEGALVNEVIEGSLAESLGIENGDIITKLNKTKIKSAQDLIDAVDDIEEGKDLTIKALRDGKKIKMKVKTDKF